MTQSIENAFRDKQYQFLKTTACGAEVDHEYHRLYDPSSEKVHILHNPLALSLLHRFCHLQSGHLVTQEVLTPLYSLLLAAASHFLPHTTMVTPTRMKPYALDRAYNSSSALSPLQVAITAVLRAGDDAAGILSRLLALTPGVSTYRDYIVAEREAAEDGSVTGTLISASKLSSETMSDAAPKVLCIPEPMGATASTTDAILHFYDKAFAARGGLASFSHIIGLYLIVTPEFVGYMAKHWSQVEIFSHRLDRGLSDAAVLETKLGSRYDEEKGLTERGYIVPGAGDVGHALSIAD